MLETILQQLVREKKQQGLTKAFIRNSLKEYLQYPVLQLIYTHKIYKKMIFKGGSCLRICFNLPRLSEDLDFDHKNLNLAGLEAYLLDNFQSKYLLPVKAKIQKQLRLYLKFSLLHRLDLAKPGQSDQLFVKIETAASVPKYGKTELTPISKFGCNFLVAHFDLPSLLSGKINALLTRLWFKGKQDQIDIKGRDFYDLFWFLQRGVKPNMKMLKGLTDIASEKQLKKVLLARIKQTVTPQKLKYDLQNFFPDPVFVEDFSKNYLQVIKKYL